VISVGAAGAAVIHAGWPHLIDAVTAALLLLAALPWLAPIVKTLEVSGVGKIELRELERTAQEALGAATSAAQKADLALAGASGRGTAAQPTTHASAQDVAALVREYNRIRETQRSGPARTTAMTAVVRRMIDVSSSMPLTAVQDALRDKDRGQRLLAYAFLYTRPEPSLLNDLMDAVRGEDTPFGQYWGIQALGKVIGSMQRVQINDGVVRRLRAFAAELQPDTDRHYELSRLLRSLDA